ncbi:TetR family transcriptional regulator [Saccharopolyspora sp. HNM0983]|uniref:TetR family transcriptional regulator n=1 Tax=Saccharopolyspora montiporae TaxID=2781240 RepID=A0A929BD42_9PSEU|nr:TetR family transcriptional regulator [Saccharopolyspora sp. HNM0983]
MHGAAERPHPQRSLSERRRDALRVEVAREAVRLFLARGVAATTGDQIARAAGISTRTLWRHFPTKESCVRPLLAAGLDAATAELRGWPPRTDLPDFLLDSCGEATLRAADPAVLDLIRMTLTEPALRAVWLQAHDDALPVLCALLAGRSGADPDDLRVRVHAATLNGALRAAAEEFAQRFADDPSIPDTEIIDCLRTALAAAAEGLPY